MTLLAKLRALCCKEPPVLSKLARARAKLKRPCPPTKQLGRPYLVVKLKDDVTLPADPGERDRFLAEYGWKRLEAEFGRLFLNPLIGPVALEALDQQTTAAIKHNRDFQRTRFEKYLRLDSDRPLPLAALAKLEEAFLGDPLKRIFERPYVHRPGPPPGLVDWTDDPWAPYQMHLDGGGIGINVKAAWDNNLAGADGATTTGQPLKFRNVDCGWRLDASGQRLDHEDLGQMTNPPPDHNDPSMTFHGTAALGIILAKDNRTGVVGIVPNLPDVGLAYYDPYDPVHDPAHPNPYSLANAIGTAAASLQSGDVILIEAQVYRTKTSDMLAPPEVYDFEWRAIQVLTAAGIIVVEPCGNGTNGGWPPLDVDALPFADSGAILVSVAASWPHLRLAYSAYGNRVDCYAWGDTVYTCWDYGSSSDYGVAEGTTAAAAIIAGAALSVQCAHIEKKNGARLNAQQMRDKLRSAANGIPPEPDGGPPFGVMPDVYAIINAL